MDNGAPPAWGRHHGEPDEREPAPVLTAGGVLNYTENQAATAIDPGVTVTDADSATLTSATVRSRGTARAAGRAGVREPARDQRGLPPGTCGDADREPPANYQTAPRADLQNTSDDPARRRAR
jgi:hypothetical protein